MVHSCIKSYKYKIGKNQYLVIKITQSAHAETHLGNALASNAVNVKIDKTRKKRSSRKS